MIGDDEGLKDNLQLTVLNEFKLVMMSDYWDGSDYQSITHVMSIHELIKRRNFINVVVITAKFTKLGAEFLKFFPRRNVSPDVIFAMTQLYLTISAADKYTIPNNNY